jgi:hypothetical protein
MTFHTAAKAVELKELIDNAPAYLPQIGRCILLEKEFREDYMRVRKEDSDSKDENSPIECIQNKLIGLYEMKGYHMNDEGFQSGELQSWARNSNAVKYP